MKCFRLLRIAVGLVLVLGTTLFAGGRTSFAAIFSPPIEPLIDCLAKQDASLSVLFMVDVSASLGNPSVPGTDPTAKRVEGLQGAVRALNQIAEDRDVYVDVMQFGSGSVRAFSSSQWPQWGSLAGQSAVLVSLMEDFRNRSSQIDTNYGSAMAEARQVLDQARPGSCRLMVWFTDGVLDFEPPAAGQPRRIVGWDRPTKFSQTLSNESDRRRVLALAQKEICRAGGVADWFRGETGDISKDGVFVVAVGLGPEKNFAFLKKIVANSSGDCGRLQRSGYLLPVVAVTDLVGKLIQATDPPLAVSPAGTAAFEFPESVSELRLRAVWDPALTAPTLRSPGSDAAELSLGSTSSDANLAGATVSVLKESNGQAVILLRSPRNVGGWAGTWSLVRGGSLASDAQLALQQVRGGLALALDTQDVVRRGRTSPIVVHLESLDGAPRTARAVEGLGVSGSTFAISTDAAVRLSYDGVDSDGTVLARLEVPKDFAPSELVLEGVVSPVVEFFPGGRVELAPTQVSLGSLNVKDLPRSPIVDPPLTFRENINQDRRTIETTLRVSSEGPESGGCISLDNLSLGFANGEAPVVRLFDGSEEIPVGTRCGIEINDGETRNLRLVIEADRAQARTAGLLEGVLRVTAQGKVEPIDTESFEFEFKAQIVPEEVTENPGLWKILPYLLIAAAAPLIALYAYNYFVAARLRVDVAYFGSVPVVLRGQQLLKQPTDGSNPVPIVVSESDLQPEFTSGPVFVKEYGRLNVTFAAKLGVLPWDAPRARVEASGADFVVAERGTTRDGHRGKSGLHIGSTWVYVSDTPPPFETEATPDVAAMDYGLPSGSSSAEDRQGTLVFFLAPMYLGAGNQELRSATSSLVVQAGLQLSEVYARGLKPPRWPRRRPLDNDSPGEADGNGNEFGASEDPSAPERSRRWPRRSGGKGQSDNATDDTDSSAGSFNPGI